VAVVALALGLSLAGGVRLVTWRRRRKRAEEEKKKEEEEKEEECTHTGCHQN
jgi:hypothetical protein